jgi:hypothetical protein
MSELRRWSAEGATPEERQLLEASRGERPDPAARARMLLALGMGGPVGGGPTSGSGGGGAAGPTGAVGASTAATLTKLIVLGAGVLGLGTAGVVGLSRTRDRATHSRPPPIAQVSTHAAPSSTPVVPSVESAAPKDAPAIAPAPILRTKPARRARSARDEGPESPTLEPSLTEEVAALDRARAALAARDTPAALRALDVYRVHFVRGRLADEEVVLRVQVLLARGDLAGAGAAESVFSKAHPRSPYVARLRALVSAEERAEEEKVIGAGAGGQ